MGLEDVPKVCAFGDDVTNPMARRPEGPQLYGGESRKDEDDQFGWKAKESVDLYRKIERNQR